MSCSRPHSSLLAVLTRFEDDCGDKLADVDLHEPWVLSLLREVVIKEWFGPTGRGNLPGDSERVLRLRSVKTRIELVLEKSLEHLFRDEENNPLQIAERNGVQHDIAAVGDVTFKDLALVGLIQGTCERVANAQSDQSVDKNTFYFSHFLAELEESILIPYCSTRDSSLNARLLELIRAEMSADVGGEKDQCQVASGAKRRKLHSASCKYLKSPNTELLSSQRSALCLVDESSDSLLAEGARGKTESIRGAPTQNLRIRLSGLLSLVIQVLDMISFLGLEKIEILPRSRHCTEGTQHEATRTSVKTAEANIIRKSDLYQVMSRYFALMGERRLCLDALEDALKASNQKTQRLEIARQLIVRLLQGETENDEARATQLLQKYGFTARIRGSVFRFEEEQKACDLDASAIEVLRNRIAVLDNVLPATDPKGVNFPNYNDLEFLRNSVFNEAFFEHHGYDCLLYDCLLIRKNPDYFSLFHDLEKPRNKLDVVLKLFVERVKNACTATSPGNCMVGSLPDLSKARYAETWTHRRTHLGFHQLHVDSKNEGRTKHIENPVATFVIFLETVDGNVVDEENAGSAKRACGPTLITNQVRGSEASTLDSAVGFFVFPKNNRAVCFPGDLYHGVLPGRIVEEGQNVLGHWRHTLMVSLWEELEETQINTLSIADNCPETGNRVYGPCRSVCRDGAQNNPWMKDLLFYSEEEERKAWEGRMDDEAPEVLFSSPVFAGRIWEQSDGSGPTEKGRNYGLNESFQF